MPSHFIAYFRVSTNRQGVSGLGLEAQRHAAAQYCKSQGGLIAEEFTEVESGKRTNRAELPKALAACQETGATLLIAKLDRLARNVHFISGLLESNVNFIAADMPNADKFMFHVYAAMAEEEGRRILERSEGKRDNTMTIKNVLVAYSGWSSAQSPLKHALKIAEYHDAWLTGIVGHGKSKVLSLIGGQAPREFVEILKENENKEIARIKEVFADLVEQHCRTHVSEIVDVFDQDGATIASFARVFDLIVTAPQSTDQDDEHMSANPDLIALQSGRPVLIVPKDYDAPGLSTHVVVAWDGKRASARAIGDAMSLLEEKGKVTVLTIGNTVPPGTDRLIQNLRRHEINVEHLQQAKSGSIGGTILSVTQEIGGDLVVMGAYEHSKFAHDMFGGVTTDVLKETTVPVFMSH